MTAKFLDHEDLIKGIVLRKINKDNTIIHVDTVKEVSLSKILSMTLLEIQKMGRFAVC